MRYFLLFLCLNSIVWSRPYVKKFWKPLQFEQKKEIFDRNNLIPIEEGEYNFSEELPEKPETIERIITAGNVNENNESFENKELSADNVIRYLKDPQSEAKHKVNVIEPMNVYVNPIRKIKEI